MGAGLLGCSGVGLSNELGFDEWVSRVERFVLVNIYSFLPKLRYEAP